MKKFYALLTAITMAFVSLLFVQSPAAARPARVPSDGIVFEVVETLDSSWDVRGAVADIDWYTASNWKVVSKCSRSFNCIKIGYANIHVKSSDPYGHMYACSPAGQICKIGVDTADARKNSKFNAATKRWLIRHELGHYRFLQHRNSCDSTMYQYNRCNNGKIPPYAFTTAEQKALRNR